MSIHDKKIIIKIKTKKPRIRIVPNDSEINIKVTSSICGIDATRGLTMKKKSENLLNKFNLDSARLIKVKQPWALHLVRGIKDCENRSWKIPSGWLVIASSKKKPTTTMMMELRERTKTISGYKEPQTGDSFYQHILGLIQIQCFAPDKIPHASAWHICPNYAWMVSKAVEFKIPIPLAVGDKFQTCVYLANRPVYKKQILEKIAALSTSSVVHIL